MNFSIKSYLISLIDQIETTHAYVLTPPQKSAGYSNVFFLFGIAEHFPLARGQWVVCEASYTGHG